MYTENGTAPCFFSRALDFAHTARGGVCGLAARSSWPSEIGGSEEESCSPPLTPPTTEETETGPEGEDDGGAAVAAVQRSVANELGRNDHDDGGGVHDALIRDRQKQKDEAVEREKP